MRHDEKGREIPDPRPMEMPLGLRKPESMEEMIRRFVRVEASRIAQKEGMETFEEADDFEVEDDDFSDAPTQYMVPEVGPEGPESLDGVVQAKPDQVESPEPETVENSETEKSKD